jgi:hypothetical protein
LEPIGIVIALSLPFLGAWQFESLEFTKSTDELKRSRRFVEIMARPWSRFSYWRYALRLRPLPAPAHLRNRNHFHFDLNPRRRRESTMPGRKLLKLRNADGYKSGFSKGWK